MTILGCVNPFTMMLRGDGRVVIQLATRRPPPLGDCSLELLARLALARPGLPGQARPGHARLGLARPGLPGQARPGHAWLGLARLGVPGQARPGHARLARPGQAWPCEACRDNTNFATLHDMTTSSDILTTSLATFLHTNHIGCYMISYRTTSLTIFR